MEDNSYSLAGLKVTAMVYATVPSVVEHVRQTGHLPKKITAGGLHIAMRVLMEQRGRDPVLNEKEQMVLEAILRDRRLPGGGVVFVDPEPGPEKDGQ
ncbi:MAG: hypothetical protein GYA48_06720 [Chloroflexi bacterium]|nr:hypothetical protein [Chloroflexota bacterium]